MKYLLNICFLVRRGSLFSLMAMLVTGRVHAQITINEIMADNQSTITIDGIAEFPDYIELYNNSDTDRNLAGWRLTDAPSLPTKYIIPTTTDAIVPAFGYLVLLGDKLTNSPGLHFGFGLGKLGGIVQLYDNTGALQDVISYGVQIPDMSIGREPPANGTNFVLTEPSPGAENVPAPLGDPYQLKINEWSALNGPSVANPDDDWFEIYNPDTNAVAFGGFFFTDNPVVVPATNPPVPVLSFLRAGGFFRIYASDTNFPGDQVNFKLSSTSGDNILFYDQTGSNLIDHVKTSPQSLNEAFGRLPDGYPGTNYQKLLKATPNASNFQPLNAVVINEVLAHTDPPLEDAIELYNPTATNVNIGGWWLSNRKDNPFKFHIPAGTIINSRGYLVFYEKDFDPDFTGDFPSFRLNSAHGDTLFLFTGRPEDNFLTGYFRDVSFDSAENAVSFGRYMKSDGTYDVTAMSRRTFGGVEPPASVAQFRAGTGATNPYPKIGRIVINEIHYHPTDIGTNDNSIDEYIELYNYTGSTVELYDPAGVYVDEDGLQLPPGTPYADGTTNTWRIKGGVDFAFPPNRTLGAGRYLLVVNFDPQTNVTQRTAFTNRFNIPASVPLFGPYKGKLSNNGADVDLYRPDAVQGPQHPDFKYVPYIRVDHVKYSDTAPWPITADGQGFSLQRIAGSKYGNDVINWKSAEPTAGRSSTVPPTITTQPQNRTNVAGTPVSLSVVIKGTAPFDYQWMFNDAPLDGMTNTSLLLPNVQPIQEGGYSVIVSNDAGAVTSVVAMVIVNCPYAISPLAVTYNFLGGTTNFNVTTTSGCDWTVVNTNAWITILSDANGMGNGTVSYRAETNNSNFQLKGNLVIGDRIHVVTVAGKETNRPTVTITSPLPNTRIYSNTVTVRGTAADNIGIDRVECQFPESPEMPPVQITGTTRWSFELNLVPGTNWVNVKAFDLAGNQSLMARRSFFHVVTNYALTVVTNVQPFTANRGGSVAPAYNGKYLELNRNYTVTATPAPRYLFSNWIAWIEGVPVAVTNSPTLRFSMQSNLIVMASFVANPFIPTKGVYNGLFFDPFLKSHDSSGAFNLTVTEPGAYSGKVTLAGKPYPVAGVFDLNGLATNRIAINPSNSFRVEWQLALEPGVDLVTGHVFNGVWDSPLSGTRTWFHSLTNKATNFAGKYTLAIQPGPTSDVFTAPQGNGYATGPIDLAGNFSLAGVLADSTPLTIRPSLAKDGRWPLYVALYGGKGSILGWVTNYSDPAIDLANDLTGDLFWTRPSRTVPAYHTNGFMDSFSVVGSRYTPPAPAARPTNSVLPAATYYLYFTGGNLPDPPPTGTVSISTNNRVTVYPGPGVSMSMALSSSNGIFSGNVTNLPNRPKPVPYKGVVLQKTATGRGFFLGTNESGRIYLENYNPPPPP